MNPAGAARRCGATGAVVALLSGVLLLGHAGDPATAGAQPLATGVTNIGSSEPLAFQRVREAGGRFVRIALHWAGTVPGTEPAAWDPTNPTDPNYDWEKVDLETIRAVQAGLTPILHVGGSPPWAQRCATPATLPSHVLCDPDPAKLASFATAAARRYSGSLPGLPRVRYWQALNEPNLSLFFFPQFDLSGRGLSPHLYRDLINAFYPAVKSVHSSNLVVLAGLGPIAVPKWTIGPMSFTRQMLCMRSNSKPKRGNCGGGVHFDIFAIQPYTTGGPTHQGGVNDVELGDLPKLRRLIAAADRAGRIKSRFKRTPLWVTEFSWDTKPPDPGGLPMRIATRWTAEALYGAWRAGVSVFLWYSLNDELPSGQRNSESLESGLYFRGATLAEDRPKRVMRAFRFPFVAYPGRRGLRIWGRTPNERSGRVIIQVRRKGGWRRLGTVRAAKDGILRGALRGGYGRSGKGAARALYRGQASPPFAMRGVADFYQPPFGAPVG